MLSAAGARNIRAVTVRKKIQSKSATMDPREESCNDETDEQNSDDYSSVPSPVIAIAVQVALKRYVSVWVKSSKRAGLALMLSSKVHVIFEL